MVVHPLARQTSKDKQKDLMQDSMFIFLVSDRFAMDLAYAGDWSRE